MGVILPIAGRPELSQHEAHGIRMLLTAIDTREALEVAAKLRAAVACNVEVEFTDTDKQALLEALKELRRDRVPARLLNIEEALAEEMGPH